MNKFYEFRLEKWLGCNRHFFPYFSYKYMFRFGLFDHAVLFFQFERDENGRFKYQRNCRVSVAKPICLFGQILLISSGRTSTETANDSKTFITLACTRKTRQDKEVNEAGRKICLKLLQRAPGLKTADSLESCLLKVVRVDNYSVSVHTGHSIGQ